MKKPKKKSKKIWRINVFVIYYQEQCVQLYRFNILEVLKNLASIYRLDYAIDVNYHPSTDDSDSTDDLIYFRSNSSTRIEKKEFYSIINGMFKNVPSVFYEGVEVGTQLYKSLNDFPFPSEYYRPLNYPWVEYHQESQKKTMVSTDAVMKIIEEEQDSALN